MRFLPPLLFAAAALAAVTARAADPVPSLDLRGFHPPVDPDGFLYLEPAKTPGPGNWNVGAYGSYAFAPVVLENGSGNEVARVVEHQVSVDYFAGLGIGGRYALGIILPTVLYQTGDDAPLELPESTPLPHTALGDLGIAVKATIAAPSDLGGFGLALLGRVHVPSGNPRSYVSEGSLRGEIRALGELNMLAIAVRGTAGVRGREKPQNLVRDQTDAFRFGADVPWGIGVSVRPQAFGIDREGRWKLSLESHGAIGTTPEFAAGPQSPVQIGLSARYTPGEVSALFGVEAPLNDAVGNPLVRPVVSVGWAPRFEDADEDGIEDEADECPELAEDRDGFEDNDGCPDFDNDGDGVSDGDDRCPKELEDADEFQDEDGCVDPDNDADGVLDGKDACPLEKGSGKPPSPGCPDPDPDGDGVLGNRDKCPAEGEDKDGFQDGDGCPDPDNDGDGVLDPLDMCPAEKGEAHASLELNGCLVVDHDGDTFDDTADKCPKEPEDFDGIEDDDGCPDEKAGEPLVTLAEEGGGKVAVWKRVPRIAGDDVEPKSLPALRALAQLLNAHPTWIAAVGARAEGRSAAAEQAALNRAFAVVLTLRWLTHRDAAAEAVGWAAVKDLGKAAAGGVGVLILAPKENVGGTP